MADSVAGRLPDEIKERIAVNASKPANDATADQLDLFEWSFAELNVPPYAEPRIFRNIGRRVCDAAGRPREMELRVQAKASWFQPRRQLVCDCQALSK